jgi:hypothetical protein
VEQKINTLEINGVQYVRADTVSKQPEPSGNLKIVVLQRGWVLVGYLSRNGSDCKLENASVVREWGTTKGLGELAKSGPMAGTKLDKSNGVVEFDYLTVVFTNSCEESQWKNKF